MMIALLLIALVGFLTSACVDAYQLSQSHLRRENFRKYLRMERVGLIFRGAGSAAFGITILLKLVG